MLELLSDRDNHECVMDRLCDVTSVDYIRMWIGYQIFATGGGGDYAGRINICVCRRP
jgi:hypothetical protein